jgi:integrase
MASVRKRNWTTKQGEKKTGWFVDYYDQHHKRQRKLFTRKKNADAFALTAQLEVRDGTHVAEPDSVTVAAAGNLWITTGEAAELERTTVEQYRQHLDLHIVPFIGKVKLAKLNVPFVRDFADKLRAYGRSPTMVKYVIRSLGSLLADAQERGLIIRNPVHELRSRRRHKRGSEHHERRGSKLKIGVDIPTPDEIKRILQVVTGRDRVFLLTDIFTGLRASEMRGLPWKGGIDFKKGELHVIQRADRFGQIGKPKTEAAERTIPLPSPVVSALREWKLACPKGLLDLVFPDGNGNVEYLVNIVQRIFWPAQIAAGVTSKTVNDKGAPAIGPKYTGLHSLRHFYASWCINRKVDGGLELPPKVVQQRMGHSSIVVTMDTYGHLFPRADDSAELTEAASFLLS